MRFLDRDDAGHQLADRVALLCLEHPVVVGIPPGGIPVAFAVARHLDAPLDIVGVRTLGAPLQPQIAIGAVGEHGVLVLDHRLVKRLSVASSWLATQARDATSAMRKQVGRLRNGLPAPPVRGRTVVLVADGITTGLQTHAAIDVLRRRGASHVVLATPVAAVGALTSLRRHADDVVCVEEVSALPAIGRWYRYFHAVSEDKVRRLLAVAAGLQPDLACEIGLRDNGGRLMGNLAVPVGAIGLVIFAHGTGGSRRSPAHRAIATQLGEAGLGTLLVDLLTEWESARPAGFVDLRLLSHRLVTVTRWAGTQPELAYLPIGYFGTGAGAAAALMAAAAARLAAAVISCGGRPDLAAGWLPQVTAPTLLIVGTGDTAVRQATLQARQALRDTADLMSIPGTTNPFDRRATLDRVADLAASWFVQHLRPPTAATG